MQERNRLNQRKKEKDRNECKREMNAGEKREK